MRNRIVPVALAAVLAPLPAASAAQLAPAKSAAPSVAAPRAGGGFLGGSDDCATPEPISGNGPFDFDLSSATTGSEGQVEPLCNGPGGRAVDFDVWYTWTATTSATVTVRSCSLTTTDTKMAVYPGSGCPVNGTALDCNDDACGQQSELSFSAVAGSTYTIQIGVWPGAQAGVGQFEIDAPVVDPTTPFCGCSTGPCGNSTVGLRGCANGTFADGAELSGSGSALVNLDDLVLICEHATPSQPGLFFQGTNPINGGNGIPFGDGLRCVGMNVIRLQTVVADGAGLAATSIDVADKGGALPGDLLHYQFWYRDPALSLCGTLFNLSNGVSVSWL